MSLKAKILLILGVAIGLTLVTLFIFFRQQFITYTLWVVGITFVLFMLRSMPYREEGRWHRLSIYKKIGELWWRE